MLPRYAGLIGGIVSAVVAGAYVFWGPSQNKTRRKDLCPGIENLGNTCFMNAVLQALAPCREMVTWLSSLVCARPQNTNSSQVLGRAVYSVLKALNYEGSEERELSPFGVLEALRQKRWVISADEQDAHELFHVLTQTLDEEASKYPPVISLFDLKTLKDPSLKFQSQHDACSRSKIPLPVLPSRHSDQPFRGLLASQLQCQQCGHKYPVRYDLFDSLSLSIPPKGSWGPVSLDNLMQHFIGSETVNSVECSGCAEKKNGGRSCDNQPLPKSTFRKKLTIGKLPRCLCIHIQRMVWLDNGMPLKRFDKVQFPEYFNMDSYVYSKAQRNRLCGGRELFNSRSSTMENKGTASCVNLLRTLNFHSSLTQNGFFLQPPNPNVFTDFNQNSPTTPTCGMSDHAYRLMAVVVHYGDMFSGHFVTYRRSPMLNPGEMFSKRWIYTSDNHVKRASLEEVLNSEAYMLFYEKV